MRRLLPRFVSEIGAPICFSVSIAVRYTINQGIEVHLHRRSCDMQLATHRLNSDHRPLLELELPCDQRGNANGQAVPPF